MQNAHARNWHARDLPDGVSRARDSKELQDHWRIQVGAFPARAPPPFEALFFKNVPFLYDFCNCAPSFEQKKKEKNKGLEVSPAI